jgi:hypothetical protein
MSLKERYDDCKDKQDLKPQKRHASVFFPFSSWLFQFSSKLLGVLKEMGYLMGLAEGSAWFSLCTNRTASEDLTSVTMKSGAGGHKKESVLIT